jgi:23S rRNA (cytosine1962-C5)-methyltransferase
MSVRVELRRDAGKVGPTHGVWIRRRQVARVLGPPDPSALAEVVDHRGRPLGVGLYSPESGIVVRLLSYAGEPGPSWLRDRLAAALAARASLGLGGLEGPGDPEGPTSGYREVNSEGDGLPGLVVDRFGAERVVQITTAPMHVRRAAIVAALTELAPLTGTTIVLAPAGAAAKEGFAAGVELVGGERPELLRWREHGRSFTAPAPPGQKTGAYHDQRDNREQFAALVGGRGPVLDLGAHVGGFAIAAAVRGSTVVAVDQSAAALAAVERNAAANGVGERVTSVAADMFARLDDPRLAGPFAGVVFDPPKIASSRRDLPRALAAMTKTLAQLQRRVVAQGVLAICSCSHHLGLDELDRAMLDASGGSDWTRIASWGAGPDHPIRPGHAEGEYLRVRVYLRDRAPSTHVGARVEARVGEP